MFAIESIKVFLLSIAVLGILIFVHELGHFLVAKALNFCVLKFSLGFGKKLFGFVRGETEYMLSAIPLGGYVKFYGENAMGEEEEIGALSDEEKLRAKDVSDDRNFVKIHPFKRILTVVAGPLFNIIFAALLLTIILLNGFSVPGTKIGEVVKGEPAETAGISAGDIILDVDGQEAKDWEDVHTFITTGKGETVNLKIKRGDAILDFTVTPKSVAKKNELGDDVNDRLIGIINSNAPDNVVKKTFGFIEAIGLAVRQTAEYTILTFEGIIKLITRKISFRENVGGPIMIIKMTGEVAHKGLAPLLHFMAVISISLGALNLMPIPILDGGAILFFLIELLKGKPISLKKRLIAQQIGMVLLIALMLFAFYNDIARFFVSKV